MLFIKKITHKKEFASVESNMFCAFLHEHLGEFGDPLEDIERCLDYALSTKESEGGFALAAYHQDNLVGALIMNNTGMSGYIPEHILVYIAVDKKYRGNGFGKQLIEEALKHTEGDVKLHVEYNNPAMRLYERIGFKNKYADMRFQQKK